MKCKQITFNARPVAFRFLNIKVFYSQKKYFNLSEKQKQDFEMN